MATTLIVMSTTFLYGMCCEDLCLFCHQLDLAQYRVLDDEHVNVWSICDSL